MNVSIIKTNKEPQDFLKAFDEYILAGYKLLDAWITLDEEQLKEINSRIFPFNMSFDEYLAEMATIKLSLENESGF
jgi:hypothetical protein